MDIGYPSKRGDQIGDPGQWGEQLARHRDRLRRMVAIRVHRRLQGRIDPSDVIQDVFLEATNRREEYARDPDPMPLFLWLRFLTGQRIQILHRRHLGTQARDAGREVSIYRGTLPEASSAALAAQLLGRDARPSEAIALSERRARVQEALEAIAPLDRELIALRNFEQLSNVETARVLGISENAASKRYIRALKQLKDILSALPGGLTELTP
jgi:RNA polymerase sigma-70 factor, ECF subfamily